MRVLLLLCVSTALFARLNPFLPTMDVDTVTNNQPDEMEYFVETNVYLPPSSRILKEVKVVYQKLDGTIEEIPKKINKRVDWHFPLQIYQKQDESSKREYSYLFKHLPIKEIGFLKVNTAKKAVLLDTGGELIHSFMLTKPYRIVIDFRGDERFVGKSRPINDSYFKKISIGNHDGYYRTVLYLDSYYDYKIDKKEKGYLIELK